MRLTILSILSIVVNVNCGLLSVKLRHLAYNKQTKDGLLNSEKLATNGDGLYYGDVSIGTPPQNFKVLLDTSTADFWVPTLKCKSGGCPQHNKFDSSKSSTYTKGNKVYEIGYSSGTALGFYSNDTVRFAGLEIVGQSFGETTNEVGYGFQVGVFDGILGLGFPALAWRGVPPVYNAFQKGLISKPVFSFYFNRTISGFNEAELFLGGSNPKYYKGDFFYVPITEKKYWKFNLEAISVGSQKIGGDLITIIDTSTPFISGPKTLMNDLHKTLGAEPGSNGSYNCDCNKLDSMPSVSLTINGRAFVIKSNEYIVKNGNICSTIFSGVDIKFNKGYKVLLGHSFLSLYYAEFDLGNNRVGFADAA